ncbi:hypothetical protein [Actinacidiphila oryziradicis]|uniref:Uncharacterized protein n=1 Tax=Actinacidiphila oryziradicis TaxID=2571141 RepID=A0A4U0RQW9_9ACTN|nr:hypothetical protein [Actinacidiphila oryziradicis]TJZ98423.1 hypothetical protein FCI23_48265 [Actinacidiphila oryziradicis]
MPAKDELAKRRFDNLVKRVEALMAGSLKPEYQGYYGQLVLGEKAVEELGDPDDIRRAARAAGRRLGWKIVTREIDGRIFIIDDCKPPEAVRELAMRRAADAMDAARDDGVH